MGCIRMKLEITVDFMLKAFLGLKKTSAAYAAGTLNRAGSQLGSPLPPLTCRGYPGGERLPQESRAP